MIIVIAILQIGGGVWAIINSLTAWAAADSITLEFLFWNLVLAGLYGFGIAAGVMLLKGMEKGMRWSTVFQGLQMPYFMSPILGYWFVSGFHFTFYTGSVGSGFNFLLGSHWGFALFESGAPWQLGVNAAAVYLFVYLLRHLPQSGEDMYSRRQNRVLETGNP